MPPMVAWAEVETSTGKNSPWGARMALRRSSTMPGCTVTRRASLSNATTPARCLEVSMTSATPTVWPHWDVPAPRASTGTPASAAMPMARRTSSSVFGTTTPTGSIR